MFKKPIITAILSVILGFLISAIFLLIAGYNPIEVYGALAGGIFSKPRYIVQSIIYATPVIITGISVVFAFKTGLFNIGAEGQFMVGAITASFLGYVLKLPPILHIMIVFAGAIIVAGIYGGFVGFLKSRFGINEVLTSIMLNWIALYLNNLYVTSSGLKKPSTEAVYEIQETAYINIMQKAKTTTEGVEKIREMPFWGDIILRTDLNYGIFIAIILAIIVWFVLEKTTLGYSLKAVGSNKDASEFVGIDVKKNLFLSMAIAGAIAGLAGAVYITGMQPHRISMLSSHENYGFNGLSVALIGGISPIGCIFAGLFFGALTYGRSAIQSKLGAPSELIDIMIGLIVFIISIKSIFEVFYNKGFFKKKKNKEASKL